MRKTDRRRLPTALPRALLLVAICSASCSTQGEDPASQPPEAQQSTTSDAEPEASKDGTDAAPDDVTAVALPAVSQPGALPRPGVGGGLVVVRVRPASPGVVVRLERREDAGWRTVDEAPQDRSGHAPFPRLHADGTAQYRAVVPGTGARGRSATVEVEPWRQVFADDFDGSALDSTTWDYRQLGLYNDDGGRECSKSDQSAVDVADGTLRLLVRADQARAGEECVSAEGTHDYYLNGHVSTEGRFAFTYGVAAARVRFQEGRGQHGAFWMQRQVPAVPGDAEGSGAEIDVAEFFGEGYPQGGLASFVYYLNKDNEDEKIGGVHPGATRQLPQGDDWWRSYHVFSVEWTPERYVFRVDGRESFRTDEAVSGVDQFLVLSLLTSDWELHRLDRTRLPSQMDVDWVRVWQQPGT